MDKAIEGHWETIYKSKEPHEVSWTQEVPTDSLDFIHTLSLPKTARILDVGGGDSRLVDHLLTEGFKNITVLDISAHALEKAKKRLGKKAGRVNWIVSNVLDYQPETPFDLWHDRAVFHFFTKGKDIEKYKKIVRHVAAPYLIISTFSENGPEKCSGFPVKRYNAKQLVSVFTGDFDKIDCKITNHLTPFGSIQPFQFCSFKHS